MRLWSLHPRYLDPRGLVALWREALLAQAVLRGLTRGYQHHPQLARFRAQPDPVAAIAAYLRAVHTEAASRGYAFDPERIAAAGPCGPLTVTSGQVDCEWRHLLAKLALRHPARYEQVRDLPRPECHPLFREVPGPREAWERGAGPGTPAPPTALPSQEVP